MKYLFGILFLICNQSFAQENYLNEDGTISNYAKRELLLGTLNENSKNNTRYEIKGDDLVIITVENCGNKEYDSKEMQKRAMFSSFSQLKNQISSLKDTGGYEMFAELELNGIIFKTNTICMSTTRRYHFQFSLAELNQLPEYMDIVELVEYVTITKNNKNIILVKNKA